MRPPRHPDTLSRRDFARLLAAVPLAAALPHDRAPLDPALHDEAERHARHDPRPTGTRHVTILYTNDFHSAFDPVPAFWMPGTPRLGGAAALAALVEHERARARTSFLLDAGDMYTGTLSHLTEGEALLEMMRLMRYDAMAVGNHEFDYGWQAFEQGITRVPFPVVCCNVRYRGTGVRFTRPSVILERDGVRLGVVGVMGRRAARNTIMPSRVAELDFTDPVEEARAVVQRLRPDVDVVVVLGHQGHPGPMQSDAEADAAVQRSLDEDLAFCGAVPGIDVYVGAHSHHGLERPLVHPDTGTIVTQTFGYGTRLGRIRLALDGGRVTGHDVALLKVFTDRLAPHAGVARRVAAYRARVADRIGPPVGRAARRLTRKYHAESTLGAFCCDVLRATRGADVAITNAGGLRADIPAGPIDRGVVLDALPFLNDAVTMALPGGALRAVLEQGCSLEAGMMQVAGLVAHVDLARPVGARVVDVTVNGAPLEPERTYRVTTNSFLAEGGDGYAAFRAGAVEARDDVLSALVLAHVRARGTVDLPAMGRVVRRG